MPDAPHKLEVDFEKVEESLNILRNYPDKVEVRITCYPPLISEEELKEMVPYLKGFKFIALQKYVPEETLSGEKVEPYSEDFYNWAISFLKLSFPLNS